MALALVVLLAPGAVPGPGEEKNGFDLSDAAVPAEAIFVGTVRDGIVAIDRPEFDPADEARFLESDDRVLGLVRGGEARAYPLAILDWHEIVNDTVGGEPVAISYCPLCASGVAFAARVGDQRLRFGVSGLLYNSDMLLFDRQTKSLWSQLRADAISGPMKGTELDVLPVTNTTWGYWKESHPDTKVLSRRTGHRRDYDRSPYPAYDASDEVWYPLDHESSRLPPKSRVVGVQIDGHAKAYPFAMLESETGELTDTLAGRDIVLRYDASTRTGAVFDADGTELPSVQAYWFAWFAFHPDTELWKRP